MTTPVPVWLPDAERVAASNLRRFEAFVGERHGVEFTDYAALHRWTTQQPEQFWQGVWDFCEVRASVGATKVLCHADKMPGATWFEGARLNFAENVLRKRDASPAILFGDERGLHREISHAELYRQVAGVAAALKAHGVGPGDRVAGFLPNIPETVIAMLASASVGAVWTSCSPDFGVHGVLDRFGQIQPKVLFAADGYCYNGKRIDLRGVVREITAALPCLRAVVSVPFLDPESELVDVPGSVVWQEFLQATDTLEFAQLPFDHPLYIMYSSGTTGVPKCMVHGAGGTLLQHLKEHVLHLDVKSGERLFYFTTCGWMMWNWLASSLAAGATLVLYEGSPFHPGPERLWELAERFGVQIFGVSAKYLSALEKAGFHPREQHAVTKLRAILSTGSPLAPSSYDFVNAHIGADIQLASICGGTDIISCFVLGCPVLPVYRGQIQCRGLGMSVEVVNDAGEPVAEEKGELVCTAPFPSMPIEFWNDPDGSRYHDTYFAKFPNIWCQGDYAEITAQNGVVIHGRSDAVLNPGGVRIGTAEIYRQVEKLDAIVDSVVIGQDWRGDVRVVLFVVLASGVELDAALEKTIRTTIRANATPRHVPAKIIAVADIPRAISGKNVELAVRDVVHHRPVKNTDALANPQALELFRDLPELEE